MNKTLKDNLLTTLKTYKKGRLYDLYISTKGDDSSFGLRLSCYGMNMRRKAELIEKWLMSEEKSSEMLLEIMKHSVEEIIEDHIDYMYSEDNIPWGDGRDSTPYEEDIRRIESIMLWIGNSEDFVKKYIQIVIERVKQACKLNKNQSTESSEQDYQQFDEKEQATKEDHEVKEIQCKKHSLEINEKDYEITAENIVF